jgi:hypothetical protein
MSSSRYRVIFSLRRKSESVLPEAKDQVSCGQQPPEASAAVPRFTVREESPKAARRKCLSVLNATRSLPSSEERFEWLHCRNPDGEAVVWTICCGPEDDVVGYTAALPRRVLVAGVERRCWIGSDFSILTPFRTMGPAVKLRRAAKEGVDAGRAEMFYAQPNQRMAAVHARVGHRFVGKMVRLAKPLRLTSYIQQFTSSRVISTALGRLLDPLRRVSDWKSWSCAGGLRCDSTLRFDRTFDELFQRAIADAPGVVGVRDSRYLNWRYAENPLNDFLTVSLESYGKLRGYAILAIQNDTAHIQDVFPMHDTPVAQEVLRGIVALGYRQGWQSISAVLLETSPLLPALDELGFWRREESSSLYAYCPDHVSWRAAIFDGHQWLAAGGDRDV